MKIQPLFLILRPQLQNINSGNNLKIPTREIVMEPTPAIRKPQMEAITSKMLKLVVQKLLLLRQEAVLDKEK